MKTQAGQSKLERRQQVLQYLGDWGWLSTLSTRKLQSELAKREKKRQRLVEAFPELEGPDPRILMRGLVDFTREGQWAEYDGLQSEIRAFKLELFRRKARRPGRAAQPSKSTARDLPSIGFKPPSLSWQDINIIFLSDMRVQVLGGRTPQTFNYGELGFEDKRTGNPSLAWELLRQMSETGGKINRPQPGPEKAKVQKRIEEIRKRLRTHFKIDGDPIPFNGSVYQARFNIRRGASFES